MADNVRRFRKERGYTQKELAALCDWNKNYIGNVEQGTVNVTLATLEVLAAELGRTVDELLKRHYSDRCSKLSESAPTTG